MSTQDAAETGPSTQTATRLMQDHRELWRRGERLRVETYLERRGRARVAASDLLDLVYGELILREEDGERPSLQEYLDRFPEHRDELRAQFEVHEALRLSRPFSVALSTASGDAADADEWEGPTSVPATPRVDPSSADGGPPASAPRDPRLPVVAGFDVLGLLGSGGMGTVYKAFDRKCRRMVAMKTMNRAGAAALLRFKHEFRSLLDVVHPNLVTLYELIGDGENWFLTMELLDGVDFLTYVREPCPDRFGRIRAAIRRLADGVAALHQAGKLHRDIKPSNVIVTRDGRVVLLDFGLAADQDDEGRHQSSDDRMVGTAAYMAPEQAAALPVSAASDWYSVGVMLFEAVAGRLPFTGGALMMLMDKQRMDPPAPATIAADVPDDLNDLCVDLLRRRPEDRPPADAILRRLGAAGEVAQPGPGLRARVVSPHPSSTGRGVVLVGRDRHRAALQAALDDVRAGRPVAVYLHGSSGAGKTALLQSFLDEQADEEETIVLTGRCYERESVPYKAFDSLVDALARRLGRMGEVELAAVLPRDVGSLARVFPSLRRVEAVARDPRRARETPDLQELRRRAFAALRELLARLGDRGTLIVAVDDLQWGDADSAAMLVEVMRPPDAPVLLFAATYRSEDEAASPLLQALAKAGALGVGVDPAAGLDARSLRVEPLSHDEARALAATLLHGDEAASVARRATLAETVARESQGNPYFIAELVRHVHAGALELDATGGDAEGRLVLDDVLWSRIRRLPAEAREVLEVVATSGRPLRLVDLNACLDDSVDERSALALLRAGRLVRGTGRAETDEVEAYHDRVRETVSARLAPEVARQRHGRLATVLEASGRADPEVLGVHFLAADATEKAASYFAAAADEAADALAFERAAGLYRRAIEIGRAAPDRRGRLFASLGDALANAGRGVEAASAYLTAATDASPDEALERRRRAAMQFLVSGHIDEGLETLHDVLARVGMRLPSTPRRALASLLWRRALLRLRGLHFREVDPSRAPPSALTRIDVCWSAGVGLSVVDTIRGADFQARGLLLSLAAGEPSRIARALAMEAAHAASTGGSNRRRTERLLATAESLARRVEHPYPLGMVTLARGVSAYLEGRWRLAQAQCDEAEAVFRDRCTGVAWERNTADAFSLWGLSHQGETGELTRRWPILLAQAVDRGDLYAAMNLSSYLMSIVRLAADEPARAREELAATNARWSRRGYHVQHNDALWAAVQIELYDGRGPAAWRLLDDAWPALRRSLLLRVQFIRTSMRFLRARAALAAALELRAKDASGACRLLAVAGRDARALEREKMPCPAAYSRMIRASLASFAGRADLAAPLWREAVAAFESVDMNLCAAASRRRLGQSLGGESGDVEIAASESWMRRQLIREPEKAAGMIAPRRN
ncbi:serine/threonine-protein kinase [Paludisphaera mucosa]|uniref:non-specific serine/threonine protein kinase n=1 Tax=Paludisphaera mucosa TaxID=3030827 RepID=A0ABT6FC32_9BACT|nr:serine/threonine-protein kinase [Paludisphaera mucosa]MDG3005014.1 protein kinase [Paludisphaera mucosa]